jgi:hypothetical protein
VEQAFDGIEGLLRSCTVSYARFMGRLTREDSDLVLLEVLLQTLLLADFPYD